MLSPQVFSAHAQMRESKFSAVGLIVNYRERELSSGQLFRGLDTYPSLYPLQNPRTLLTVWTLALSVCLFTYQPAFLHQVLSSAVISHIFEFMNHQPLLLAVCASCFIAMPDVAMGYFAPQTLSQDL